MAWSTLVEVMAYNNVIVVVTRTSFETIITFLSVSGSMWVVVQCPYYDYIPNKLWYLAKCFSIDKLNSNWMYI